MAPRRAQLVALLIVALIFGAAQCVASCTAGACNSTLPPCHQHTTQATSGECTHNFVLPDTHGYSVTHVTTMAVLPPVIEIEPSFVVVQTSVAAAFSPPHPSFSTSSILRI